MARSDLLLNLVRAGSVTGDQVGFRRTVEAMIAEERERQHHVVADRLAEYLANKGKRRTVEPSSAMRRSGSYDERHPERNVLSDLVLPEPVSRLRARSSLRNSSARTFFARTRSRPQDTGYFLAGPPGNRKASLAEAIAGELAYPLLVVALRRRDRKLLGRDRCSARPV